MSPYFLGGSLSPLGLAIAFLDRPLPEVRDALTTCRVDSLGQAIGTDDALSFPDSVRALDPLEAPWTTELLIDCGKWTCYLNNGIDGGDPTAAAPYLTRTLSCQCVIGHHVPPFGPGHCSTRFSLLGPSGAPPLGYLRVISAHRHQGGWRWQSSGTVLPFEHADRYVARRIKCRFDRSLLVEYLVALGIRVDDADFYGEGVALRQLVTGGRRQETVAQVRERFGWTVE